ncbi:MAG: hypothetical protein F4X18_02265 [Acidimicrobiia bacterium]|nr:hypothetical protein [Acidimicrobiia bacterium]
MTGMADPPGAIGDEVRSRGWSARTSAIVVAMVSLATLVAVAPHLLLVANTPTGGDMGAHVLGPAYLRDVLLPSGRIMGWSNHWFAGFPIFYFYFPLPSLVIVALDLALPYGVAFKTVTVIGLVALAPATYFLVRSMGLARPVAAVAAAAGGVYAFMETPTPNIFGGTIASSLAGEFSYSWSFAFMLVYLGCLIRAVHDDRTYFLGAAAALAGTALCHVIPTMGAVFASLFVLVVSLLVAVGRSSWWERLQTGERREGAGAGLRWWIVPGTWVVGFMLAAFWALPLVIRLRYTTEMNWQPLAGFDELFPVELWPVAILGVTGLVMALRRTGRAVAPAALTLVPIPAFFLLSQGAKLWNGRALPHWFYGLHLFAGIAVGLLVVAVCRRLPERTPIWWIQTVIVAAVWVLVFGPAIGEPAWDVEGVGGWFDTLRLGPLVERISGPDLLVLAAGVLLLWLVGRRAPPATRIVLPVLASVAITGIIFVGVVTEENYVGAWARWNYLGYEGKATWPEYEGVMSAIGALPPGRVQWEANSELNKYGTPMAPMLFPYWTEGTHPSMEGLYFESSVTTPFHFLNASELASAPSNPIPGLAYHTGDIDRGAVHMRLFNVSYYVAYTDTAKGRADRHEDFTFVQDSPPFRIYSLPESSLVEVAVNQPWVFEETGSGLLTSLVTTFTEDTDPHFVDVALDWYEDISLVDQWIVADGPSHWERITPDLDGATVPVTTSSEVEVSDVVLEDHRVAFKTTGVGLPHLIKVSYFPNWTAYGAEGPWRATPAFMVVVPTGSEVELRFENTWVERVGAGLTGAGGIILVIWLVSAARRRSTQAAPPPEGLRDPALRGTGRTGHG